MGICSSDTVKGGKVLRDTVRIASQQEHQSFNSEIKEKEGKNQQFKISRMEIILDSKYTHSNISRFFQPLNKCIISELTIEADGCNFDDKSVVEMISCMNRVANLRYLSLSFRSKTKDAMQGGKNVFYNTITQEGATQLFNKIKESFKELTNLSIDLREQEPTSELGIQTKNPQAREEAVQSFRAMFPSIRAELQI